MRAAQRRMFDDYTTGPTAPTAPTALYQAPIIRLRIVREGSTEAPRRIKSPADVAAALMARFADADREVMVAVLLDTKNTMLAIDPVFVGSLDRATITMREAFKSAVIAGAAAVIFAHNHPSGTPDPSPEDLLITRQLRDAGKLLEIDVLDHLVLGHDRYVSIRERHNIW